MPSHILPSLPPLPPLNLPRNRPGHPPNLLPLPLLHQIHIPTGPTTLQFLAKLLIKREMLLGFLVRFGGPVLGFFVAVEEVRVFAGGVKVRVGVGVVLD